MAAGLIVVTLEKMGALGALGKAKIRGDRESVS